MLYSGDRGDAFETLQISLGDPAGETASPLHLDEALFLQLGDDLLNLRSLDTGNAGEFSYAVARWVLSRFPYLNYVFKFHELPKG